MLTICGVRITDTHYRHNHSALEALCVDSDTSAKVRLARQLTAASLNCVMSNGRPDCTGNPSAGSFRACNAICASGTSTQMRECTALLACLNGGGDLTLATRVCATGTCSDNGQPCAPDDLERCASASSATCVPTSGNCHDQPLVNTGLGLDFGTAQRAGSTAACDQARQSSCTIFTLSCR
jgi:hypothetical protein